MAEELNVLNTIEIPKDQKTFKIGEVARLLDLEPYVLRYWETEFEQLAPEKSRSGQRVYRRADIEMIHRIQELLHVEQYTIVGARRQLELDESAEQASPGTTHDIKILQDKLTAQAEIYQSRIRELEEHLEIERAHVAQSEEMATTLERDLGDRIDALSGQLDEAMGQLEERQHHVQQLEQQLEDADHVDEKWSTMSMQLNEDMERLQGQLEASTAEKLELATELEQLINRYEEAISQRDQLQAHCTELMGQRTQLEAHCDELSARLRAQRQGRQRTLDHLRRELVALHSFAAS